VKQLIAAGSDVDAANNYNWLPLHMAAECPDDAAASSMVQQLLAAGAAVDARGGHSSSSAKFTHSVKASRMRCIGAMQGLLAAGAEADFAALYVTGRLLDNSKQKGPICFCGTGRNKAGADACGCHGSMCPICCDVQLLHALLCPTAASSGAAQAAAPVGATALVIAIYAGRADVVQCLLEAGAAVNAVAVGWTGERNASRLRMLCGKEEYAPTLLMAGPIFDAAAPGDGIIPLVAAIDTGSADMVRMLLQAGAAVGAAAAAAAGGFTPVMAAVEHGSLDMVTMLLRAGAPTDAELLERGTTALNISAMMEARLDRIVWALLGSGAKLDAVDSTGFTALQFAAKHGCVAGVRALLQAGASVHAAADEDGGTALHVILWPFDDTDPPSDADKAAVVAELLKAGASASAVLHSDSMGGVTPLHLAARYGPAAVVQQLLAAGAPLEATTATRHDSKFNRGPHCAGLPKESSAALLEPVDMIELLHGACAFSCRHIPCFWGLSMTIAKLHYCLAAKLASANNAARSPFQRH
jgi:ankyrin repeat protein